jgi:hypothetical protein
MFLVVSPAVAAILNFEHQSDVVQAGDTFFVALMLDTQGQIINAIEAQVKYGTNELELIAVQDGDSIINFWVQRPEYLEDGKILFSGITPGGITGRDLNLLTLKFEAKKEGVGTAMLQDVQVLLHDGLGTPLQATLVPLSFNILGQSTVPAVTTQYIDTESPEPFTPVISSDPDVFEGRKFLVFATEDKGSGISFFEIKEGNFGNYRHASSPYEIKDQSLGKEIFVRAVDNEGNAYVATVYPQSYVPWYQTLSVKTAILVVCLVFAFLLYRRFFFRRVS